MNIAVIGGGAAGFMAAITAKEYSPTSNVVLFEKSNKVLSKVKISGGGRCNVTHACFSISELSKNYPRGEKLLKKSFHQFHTLDTIEWFENRGVKLKTESDNRMFPQSNDSQTIVDCLFEQLDKLYIPLKYQSSIQKITRTENGILQLHINDTILDFDKVIVATGGSPSKKGLHWIEYLNHQIIDPVPSLFTFNMPSEKVKDLMGVVAPNTSVRVQGTKIKQEGPLLITHWGMSGPAILKTSSWGARLLAEKNYNFNIQVNWTNLSESEYQQIIQENLKSKRSISNKNPFNLPNRLWLFLLQKLDINPDLKWLDLNKKTINRLVNVLFSDLYKVDGKTTFKEEFVTCGGVCLSNINYATMESNTQKGMYFCGEVLNIDGVTGGFNFQSAWTTGFIAGKNSVK
jgi:predicted Rossmann fold flavoprotein